MRAEEARKLVEQNNTRDAVDAWTNNKEKIFNQIRSAVESKNHMTRSYLMLHDRDYPSVFKTRESIDYVSNQLRQLGYQVKDHSDWRDGEHTMTIEW